MVAWTDLIGKIRPELAQAIQSRTVSDYNFAPQQPAPQQFAPTLKGYLQQANSQPMPPAAQGSPYAGTKFQGVTPRLADATQDFLQDYPQLRLNSGYRSTEKQAELYADRANNPNPVAPPGSSKHESGNAVDIGGLDAQTRRLAQDYGLHFPVANDPVHAELINGNNSPRLSSPTQIAAAPSIATQSPVSAYDLASLPVGVTPAIDTPATTATPNAKTSDSSYQALNEMKQLRDQMTDSQQQFLPAQPMRNTRGMPLPIVKKKGNR